VFVKTGVLVFFLADHWWGTERENGEGEWRGRTERQNGEGERRGRTVRENGEQKHRAPCRGVD
jgi:hypothetical protein